MNRFDSEGRKTDDWEIRMKSELLWVSLSNAMGNAGESFKKKLKENMQFVFENDE